VASCLARGWSPPIPAWFSVRLCSEIDRALKNSFAHFQRILLCYIWANKLFQKPDRDTEFRGSDLTGCCPFLFSVRKEEMKKKKTSKKKAQTGGKIAFDFSRLSKEEDEFLIFLKLKLKDRSKNINQQEFQQVIQIIIKTLSVPKSNLIGHSDDELFSAFLKQYDWLNK
jgi:hypothetical protein